MVNVHPLFFDSDVSGENSGDIHSCLIGADPTSRTVDFVCFGFVFLSRLPF